MNYEMSRRSARFSNSPDHHDEENIRNGPYNIQDNHMIVRSDGESEQNISTRIEERTPQSNKRKRMNKFNGRVSMCLDANEVVDACEIEEQDVAALKNGPSLS